MVKSLYIHIPFCTKICSYCDFCKLLYNKKFVSLYLEALEKEIDSIYKDDVLDTIYIGGGTPSSLSCDELEKLFTIISKLKRSSTCEFTIEGNFESTSKEKLLLYKKYGVNRLSFGIESISAANLKFLDREFDSLRTRENILLSRELGFNNINVDLMYALRDETIDDLLRDIRYVLELNVEHISTYSLIIEEHTKLFINKTNNIDADLDSEMYEVICRELENNGYKHYEISNFAREGYYSRHNLTYWSNLEYYGFGVGASSYLNNKRITNTRSFTKYLEGKYCLEVEELDIPSQIEYEVILNLRKSSGINLEEFKIKYGKSLDSFYNYQWLVREGFLNLKNNLLFIPPQKWYISNEIIVKLLEGEVNG